MTRRSCSCTRGYGLALLFLLATPHTDAWLPRLSPVKRRSSVRSSACSSGQEDIANAWRSLQGDMHQNDQDALKVLKDLRASLKQLEAAATQLEANTPPLVQAHEVMDEAAAQLVAQLATREAMEFAQKESRIAQAKQVSEGVTLNAKLDLQQALFVPARPAKQETPKVVIPQAHDLVDTEAEKLVAELAALDANELAFKESLIDSARAASEGITMNAKLDLQQQTPLPAKETPQVVIPQAQDLKDTQAEKLVAELAALDAKAQALKESLIDSARAASEGITMNAKIDQQQLPIQASTSPSSAQKQAGATRPIPDAQQPDEEAQLLVALLANLEANEFNFKESLINHARDDSNFVTMQAKIDQQELIPMPPPKQDTPKGVIPQAHDLADTETEKLVAELAALDANALAFKESLIDAARAASEGMTMNAKIDQQEQIGMPSKNASAKDMEQQEAAHQTNDYMRTAKEIAVESSSTPTVTEQARRLKAQLASLEAAKFAVLMDMARSNAIKEEAQVEAKATPVPANKKATVNDPPKKLAVQLAFMEAQQFAIQLDIAKSDAVKEDAAVEVQPLPAKKTASGNKKQQATLLATEAQKFAMQVDRAKSDAVKKYAAVEVQPRPARKSANGNKKSMQQATQLAREAQNFAMQVDSAKSQAVTEDAAVENVQPPTDDKPKQPATQLAAEAQNFAMQVDSAKSQAVTEDARLEALRVAANPKTMEATVAAAQATEPVVMPASKITEATIEEEAVVEAVAEPFFLSDQNPNQMLEIIDVQALKSAAQEVQEASEMLADQLPDSVEKEAIIQAAQEAAESVLKEVQVQQNKHTDKGVVMNGRARDSYNMFEQKEPTLADWNNNAFSANNNAQQVVQGVVPDSTNMLDFDQRNPSLAEENNNGFSARKAQEISMQTTYRPELLEPLPQDVTNHQEDAERFFFAKQAAQEISMKEDPYYLKRSVKQQQELSSKDLSAAELAAKEHDEVDRQLKELFSDVGLGLQEVKQSLARLLRKNDDGMDGRSNSTAWEGMTP